MTKCAICEEGAVTTKVVGEYHADLLGAPFPVYLLDAVKEEWCSKCNKKLKTIIPDLEGLLHVVAHARAIHPRKLSGSEIRFLRHAVGSKAKHFAEKLDMTPENLSRVENGTKALGAQSEKLLRFYVLTKLIDDDLAAKLGKEKLDKIFGKIFEMKFHTVWHPQDLLEFRFVRRLQKITDADGSEDKELYEELEAA